MEVKPKKASRYGFCVATEKHDRCSIKDTKPKRKSQIPCKSTPYLGFARVCPGQPDVYGGSPEPPPPGVSTRSRWPGRRVPAILPGSGAPSSCSRPRAPGLPPAAPRGGWRRRPADREEALSGGGPL